MLSFRGIRSSMGLLVAATALFVTTGDVQAQYYQSSCQSGYTSVRYAPRQYGAPVVYVDEPVVYVERVRPRRYVRYRSYPRSHRYYRRGSGLGHLITHLIVGGHGHHRSRHGHHGSRRSHRRHGGRGHHSRR